MALHEKKIGFKKNAFKLTSPVIGSESVYSLL